MKKIIKGILSQADDRQRLKYLLAKDDIDDIQAALMIVYQNLKNKCPEIDIVVFAGKIEIFSESEKYYTSIAINIMEEQLIMRYYEQGVLELFNQKSECDIELIRKVKEIIESLGFYKTGEFKIQFGRSMWRNETYKNDVIRRKL